VLVNDGAVAGKSLVESDAFVWKPQQPRQPALSVLDRLAPDVLAAHLEQVERAENRTGVGGVAADEVEHRKPAVVGDNGLAVDHARLDRQSLDRLGDEREAVRQVVAVAGDQAHAAAAPVRQDPEAVVLDLVNPAGGRRRLAGRARQAWREARKRLLGAHSAPDLIHGRGHRGKDKGRCGGVESAGFPGGESGTVQFSVAGASGGTAAFAAVHVGFASLTVHKSVLLCAFPCAAQHIAALADPLALGIQSGRRPTMPIYQFAVRRDNGRDDDVRWTHLPDDEAARRFAVLLIREVLASERQLELAHCYTDIKDRNGHLLFTIPFAQAR
jgi:hypothetical protein